MDDTVIVDTCHYTFVKFIKCITQAVNCNVGYACMLSRFSRVRLCATLWTAAHQAPLSTGFSRREYWSGLPFPSPQTLHINP